MEKRENLWKLGIVFFLLAAGLYARFKGLAWHFAHIDDIGVAKTILDHEKAGLTSVFWSVPRKWTYAPFQFLITPFLIDVSQSYREILFWGRLPSAVFSFLGLPAFLFFYRLYDGCKTGRAFLAVALLAFSWENLIHAHQMHNYALGVTAMLLLLILLTAQLKSEKTSVIAFMAQGALLTLLCTMQYQILFFIPAFYLTLFFKFSIYRKEAFKQLFLKFVLSGLVLILLMSPLWVLFLSHHQNAGLNWNTGIHEEFAFTQLSGLKAVVSAPWFFIKNFLLIFQANVGFLPVQSVLFQSLVYYFLTTCFILGLFSYFRTTEILKRWIGVFWFLSLVTWLGLVLSGKLALSPTRHSLILLPFMAMTAAEGCFVLLRGVSGVFRMFEGAEAQTRLLAGVALIIGIVFLMNFNVFLETRRDPFDQKHLMEKIREYDVDYLVRADHTIQPLIMDDIQRYIGDFEWGWSSFGFLGKAGVPFDKIAWISHRNPLNAFTYRVAAGRINPYVVVRNKEQIRGRRPIFPYLGLNLSDYRILYKEEKGNGVQTEYSALTENGQNGYYFYILERKKAKP